MGVRTYHLLYTANGHKIVNSVEADSLREVREDVLRGFKNASDDGKVKITTDLEVAKKWEGSCYHVRHKESE